MHKEDRYYFVGAFMKMILLSLVALQFAATNLNAGETQKIAYRHPATGLSFPNNLAEMVIGTITDLEAKYPGLGTSVAYKSFHIKSNLYIYNLGLKQIPTDPQSLILRKHFIEVVQVIYDAEKKGDYKFIKKISDGTTFMRLTQTGPKVLYASFSYVESRSPETERLSWLYLTGYKQHFVKIRFTYDRPSQAQAEKTLNHFLNETGKMLAKEF